MKKNPVLFQLNARVMLRELSTQSGRQATLDDIQEALYEQLAERGFDWIYFLSVWKTGAIGRQVSLAHPGWMEGFRADLPDVTEKDVCGSGFAVSDYNLNSDFGDEATLKRLHERLNSHGLRLMLDYVPNHTAIDHKWVQPHPEYFVSGDDRTLARSPQNYIKVGDRIFAHGRDPYFDGWPDSLQLDYSNPALRSAMLAELKKIAGWCDGVRCDMAMLLLPDVFKRTWGIDIDPYWPGAIEEVQKTHPDFTFMAEVYWNREWELLQQGFDFTYDKELYDRLRHQDARKVREHLSASLDYQKHCARFLENHDEPRAASEFSLEQHKAAAVTTFLTPGLKFFHDGQLTGRRHRVSVHVNRRAVEPVDEDVEKFYHSLLECLKLQVVHYGTWSLLECNPAWDGNNSCDSIIAFAWFDSKVPKLLQLLVVVNYAPHDSQCYVVLPEISDEGLIDLSDVLGNEIYSRDTDALNERGLYIALGPWSYNAFRVDSSRKAVLTDSAPSHASS